MLTIETSLIWSSFFPSSQGQKGEAGDSGELTQGLPGPAGPQGPPGDPGLMGQKVCINYHLTPRIFNRWKCASGMKNINVGFTLIGVSWYTKINIPAFSSELPLCKDLVHLSKRERGLPQCSWFYWLHGVSQHPEKKKNITWCYI